MREHGITVNAIAAHFGVSKQTASAWITDPDGTRLKARKDSYRGVCIDCGKPTSGCNGPGASAPQRCADCHALAAARLQGAKALARRERWAALAREGYLPRQIADMEGVTANLVSSQLYRARVRNGIDAPVFRGGTPAHRSNGVSA